MGLQDVTRKEEFIQKLNEKRGLTKEFDSGVVINHRTQVKKLDEFKREKK